MNILGKLGKAKQNSVNRKIMWEMAEHTQVWSRETNINNHECGTEEESLKNINEIKREQKHALYP